jgi:hypothetical protein
VAGVLVLQNGPGGDTRIGEGLPFMLARDGSAGADWFQLHMGDGRTEYLPSSWPACADGSCPLSCFRRMARSDLVRMKFVRDSAGNVTGFVSADAGAECKKLS